MNFMIDFLCDFGLFFYSLQYYFICLRRFIIFDYLCFFRFIFDYLYLDGRFMCYQFFFLGVCVFLLGFEFPVDFLYRFQSLFDLICFWD